jgi:hypothetical protein
MMDRTELGMDERCVEDGVTGRLYTFDGCINTMRVHAGTTIHRHAQGELPGRRWTVWPRRKESRPALTVTSRRGRRRILTEEPHDCPASTSTIGGSPPRGPMGSADELLAYSDPAS